MVFFKGAANQDPRPEIPSQVWVYLVHYCTLSLSDIWVTRQECRVGTPYMERNFIDSLPKAKVDQSESSFLQKRHLGYVTGPK